MIDLRELDTLCGFRLRMPFADAAERRGPADAESVSPENRDGTVLVNYTWDRSSPAMAVLTWRTADGEHVWGVRVFGEGGVDPNLGFGVGASRHTVEARCRRTSAPHADSVQLDLHEGTLTVYFTDDVVCEIQLLMPLTFDGDEPGARQ